VIFGKAHFTLNNQLDYKV